MCETIDEIFKDVELEEPEMVETVDGEKVRKSKIKMLLWEQEIYGYEMELY